MNKEMYLKIRKPSLRYDYFLFFDTPEYARCRIMHAGLVLGAFDMLKTAFSGRALPIGTK